MAVDHLVLRGRIRIALAGICALAWLASAAAAADEEKPPVTGKLSKIQLSGVGWVTYRYVLRDQITQPAAKDTVSRQDLNSFDIDRVYFTADYAFDERVSWETQLEIANTAGKLNLFLKKAFLRMKNPFQIKETFVQMGEIPHVMTPTYERAWGYRAVSRVPVDRYLGISTTWVGLGAGGAWGKGLLDVEASVANEKAYNQPVDSKYKTFQGRLTLTPRPEDARWRGLKLGFWAQTNSKEPLEGSPVSASDNRDLWYGVSPSFQWKGLSAAIEWDQKSDRRLKTVSAGGTTHRLLAVSQVISGFVACDLTPRLRAFGRLDRYDPSVGSPAKYSSGLVKEAAQTVVIAGLSHAYIKGVRSIVDVDYTKYEEPTIPSSGKTPSLDPDVTVSARLEVTL